MHSLNHAKKLIPTTMYNRKSLSVQGLGGMERMAEELHIRMVDDMKQKSGECAAKERTSKKKGSENDGHIMKFKPFRDT